MSKQFLFVCGCARSGTSVTADLLRSHPKIAIGRERYNSLFKSNKQLFKPSLFQQSRFCQELLDGDTHHLALDDYYPKVFSEWGQHEYLGDKIPSLFKEYDYLMSAFNQPKILFLIRNLFDVSQSWENRRIHSIKDNGKWPHERGFEAAISEWNVSLNNTLKALTKYPDNILITSYEALFREPDLMNTIFEFLALEVTADVVSYWQQCAQRHEELERARTIRMPSRIKDFILQQADFEAYRALNSMIRL